MSINIEGGLLVDGKDVNNENVVTINNVDLSSGRASKMLSAADWALVSDKTKDCSLVLKLVAQDTYPLGTEIKLKRVSIDDTSVKFAMSFEYPSGDLYASYNVTALFSANAGMIFVNQVEANKERLPAGSQPLTNLTLCGHTFKVDSLKKVYGSITVDDTGSGTITFINDTKPDSDDVDKFLFYGTLTGGSFNQEIACIFSRGSDEIIDDAASGITYYEAFIQVYNGATAPQKLCSVTLKVGDPLANWTVVVKEIPSSLPHLYLHKLNIYYNSSSSTSYAVNTTFVSTFPKVLRENLDEFMSTITATGSDYFFMWAVGYTYDVSTKKYTPIRYIAIRRDTTTSPYDLHISSKYISHVEPDIDNVDIAVRQSAIMDTVIQLF